MVKTATSCNCTIRKSVQKRAVEPKSEQKKLSESPIRWAIHPPPFGLVNLVVNFSDLLFPLFLSEKEDKTLSRSIYYITGLF